MLINPSYSCLIRYDSKVVLTSLRGWIFLLSKIRRLAGWWWSSEGRQVSSRHPCVSNEPMRQCKKGQATQPLLIPSRLRRTVSRRFVLGFLLPRHSVVGAKCPISYDQLYVCTCFVSGSSRHAVDIIYIAGHSCLCRKLYLIQLALFLSP